MPSFYSLSGYVSLDPVKPTKTLLWPPDLGLWDLRLSGSYHPRYAAEAVACQGWRLRDAQRARAPWGWRKNDP
jgi:hypothetical protein